MMKCDMYKILADPPEILCVWGYRLTYRPSIQRYADFFDDYRFGLSPT